MVKNSGKGGKKHKRSAAKNHSAGARELLFREDGQEYAIIKEIYSFDHHFDADELYSQMIKKKYRVSRATIYNTLDLLVSLELVSRHVFKENIAKYEKSFGFRQHDHIILDNVISYCIVLYHIIVYCIMLYCMV